MFSCEVSVITSLNICLIVTSVVEEIGSICSSIILVFCHIVVPTPVDAAFLEYMYSIRGELNCRYSNSIESPVIMKFVLSGYIP